MIQVPGQDAKETGDGDCVFDARAAVRRAKLDCGVFQRRPKHPPDVALIHDCARADKSADVSFVILAAREEFGDAGPRNSS